MNISKSLKELEDYFNEEENKPEVINRVVIDALLSLVPICAHPQEMSTDSMEKIGLALQYLSDIINIVDRYE